MAMASENYIIGDLVWAKMKSYPWWPSVIAEPRKEVKKPVTKKSMHFVEFFGSSTYAWIVDEFIHPYEKYKSEHLNCSLASFKAAVNELNDYLASSSAKSRISKPKDSTTKANSLSSKKKPLQINHSPVVKPIKSPVTKSVLKLRKPESSTVRVIKKVSKRPIPETSSTSSIPRKMPASNQKYMDLLSNLSPYLMSSSDSLNEVGYRQRPTASIMKRVAMIDKPQVTPVVFDNEDRRIIAAAEQSDLKVGFIGLGNMGGAICKRLICAGFKVTVWNRTPEKIEPFTSLVTVCQTPQDVVAASDVTFCCVSNPTAAKEIVFGNCGVLKEIGPGKGYIELTSIDPETSKDIAEAVTKKEGIYLETPVLGSRELAETGDLIILAAGDSPFFERCKPCFQAMGERAFFLGEVGNAAKMNLILNMMMGTSLVCLVEALILARSVMISGENLLEIMKLCPMRCPLFVEKAEAMIENKNMSVTPLEHMQKDLQLALQLGDDRVQSLPTTAAANEALKYIKGLGFSGHDISALYTARQ